MIRMVKKSLITLVILMSVAIMLNVSYAASIGLSVGYRSITVGGSTTLTITGNDAIGKVSITSSNPNVVSVSSSSQWIEGSASVTLTTKSVGSATITVSAVDMSTGAGAAFTGANSVTITVNPVYIDTRSKNNNLGGLSVTGYELNQAFSADILEYTKTVPHEVSSIEIVANQADRAAKVNISGNTELKYGENIVTITVTAENGAQKNYILKVNREKNPDDINPYLKSLVVKNATLKNETGRKVYLNICEDISVDVNKLEIEAIPEVEGAKVEITGNEDLKVGTNKISIKVKCRDESTERIYEIIVYKSSEMLSLQEIEPEKTMKDYILEYKIHIILIAVIFIEFIVIIVLLVKKPRIRDYEERNPRDAKEKQESDQQVEDINEQELEDTTLTEDVLKYNDPTQHNTRRNRRG